MIEGTFRDGWPCVTLTVIGNHDTLEVEFIVDTGFGGALALPDEILQRIGASYTGSNRYSLADGSVRRFSLAEVRIAEDEEERDFIVLAKDGNPLVGIDFFRDLHLHIEVIEGGAVVAEAI